MPALALALLVVAPVATFAAAPPSSADIQALLDQRVAAAPGTAIVVGVVDGDTTTIYKAGTTGTVLPLDEHTQFEIGSVTKTFTATILASTVLDHSVALSDPVQRYVPANVHIPSRDGKQITPLEPRRLDEYVGTYKGEEAVYTVKRDGARLLAQLTGQRFARIYPSSKDHFFYKVVDAQIDFTRDASGKVNAIVLHQNGLRGIFVRPGMAGPTLTPPPVATSPPVVALDAATLDSYVGTYVAGADLEFTIARNGDGITVRLTGQPAYPLFASAKDRFYCKVVPAQIDFVREANGKITGLMLHQNGNNFPAVKQ